MKEETMVDKEYDISFFEKYLSLWVILGIITGIVMGALFPGVAEFLDTLSVEGVNIPIAVLLFGMMYPIMVQIDFSEVKNAVKAPRPVLLTLIVNWGIKPFTMLFFSWLFMRVIFAPFLPYDMAGEYMAGMILLGIAPCTAMVLVWSFLAKGFMGLTLVLVALNSLTMLVLYAPLGNFLLGVAEMPMPFMTIFLSIILYVGVSLVAGYISRIKLIESRGKEWYDRVFLKDMGTISKVSLLVTLVYLFMLQGGVLLSDPIVVLLIAVPLIIQTLFVFGLGYKAAEIIGLSYDEAAPAAMIGASNHFEVAIATAVTLFGLRSGAALATVVGVLIEVPLMLFLVKLCLRTRNRFKIQSRREKMSKV